MKLLAAIALAVAALGAWALYAATRPPPEHFIAPTAAQPVVLELFTSQGCSSCPPADRLAGRFAREPGMIVITRPVTYWDRQGWKDTLASPANTALQRTYAQRIDDEVGGSYTPQVVVDGLTGAVGSNENRIRRLAQAAMKRPHPALTVARDDAGGALATLSGADARPAELALVALAAKRAVSIGSGENGGREVTYTNVLVGERPLGAWSGGKARIAISADALRQRGADRYAVILREPGGGPILAAKAL
jgi:hypothetical protein